MQWAEDKGLCVNAGAMTQPPPSCEQEKGQTPARFALLNTLLYRQLVDAWSMRFWQFSGQNGHDHFFDAFGKFGLAIPGQTGAMLAEVASRAARGRVSYLEVMLAPDGGASSANGSWVEWGGSF